MVVWVTHGMYHTSIDIAHLALHAHDDAIWYVIYRSFAIQFQFYLLVPLLFKLFGRGRAWLYVCITFIIASIAFRFLAFEKITSQNNPSTSSCDQSIDLVCVECRVRYDVCA